MAACPPFQFWISFLQFIILLLPHIAIPGAQCSLNADCYIKSIEMSGDYLVVGKCTTVWLWQLGARVTVAVKLRFLLEQRLGLDHVMYALELRLFKCRLCGKYCEGKLKNILSFFVVDSFVNSQEWTLSRNVPEIRLGIVGSLSSGKSALVHRYLTGSYMQVILEQIFLPGWSQKISHLGRITGGRKV